MKSDIGRKIVTAILIILIMIFFVLDGAVIVFILKTIPTGKTEYHSFQEFRDAGAAGYMYMPETASEQQYYLDYTGFSFRSIYSFRLENEKEYDSYMNHMKNYSCNEESATFPAWDWYSKYEPTDEELEQMDYLQTNYKTMNYKEVLDISRIDIGFANAYGSSVGEYVKLEKNHGKFPNNMPFKKVIPDSIETYTILYYKPMDDGTYSQGILVNEATRRFVVYYLRKAK